MESNGGFLVAKIAGFSLRARLSGNEIRMVFNIPGENLTPKCGERK